MAARLPYRYDDLKHDRAIRVLYLEGSTSKDQALGGQLVETTPNGSYEALSYTWDADVATQELHIGEDEVIRITSNCAAALRRLRMKSTTRYLWVDAICINQQDTTEKSTQVALMGEIYANASRVAVWLGPGDENSKVGFEYLEKTEKALLPSGSSRQLSDEDQDTLISQNIEGCSEDQMNSIGVNTFWQRIWTLQELALAKDVEVYHGDTGVIQFHTLILYAISETFRNKYFKVHRNMMLHLVAHSDLRHGHPFALRSSHRTYDVLKKKASEPRDKVYALKSIYPKGFESLLVDYVRPVSEIFREATKLVIEHENSLGLLLHSFRKSQLTDLGSWVLDWNSSDIHNVRPNYEVDDSFRATNGSSPVFSFSTDTRSLFLRGLLLDHRIEWLSDLFPQVDSSRMYGSLDPWPLDWTGVGTEWMDNAQAFIRAVSGGEDVTQTVCELQKLLDFNFHRDRSRGADEDPNDLLTVMMMYGPRDVVEAWPTPADEIDAALIRVFWEFRSVFIESSGSRMVSFGHGGIGLAHGGIQPGDRLALLSGLGKPFFVRSIGDKYVLLGPAIVPDVMDGHLWPENQAILQEFEFV